MTKIGQITQGIVRNIAMTWQGETNGSDACACACAVGVAVDAERKRLAAREEVTPRNKDENGKGSAADVRAASSC